MKHCVSVVEALRAVRAVSYFRIAEGFTILHPLDPRRYGSCCCIIRQVVLLTAARRLLVQHFCPRVFSAMSKHGHTLAKTAAFAVSNAKYPLKQKLRKALAGNAGSVNPSLIAKVDIVSPKLCGTFQ